MAKKFKNINEELDRMKTLMYETDSLILNDKILKESVEENTEMDEQNTDFKTKVSSFKVAKVSDLNTLVRGGAAKFDTYKIKGTGVMQLFDKNGKMTPEGMELMKKSGLNLPAGQIVMKIGKKDEPNTDKVFFQVIPATQLSIVTKDNQIADLSATDLDSLATSKTTTVTAPVNTSSTTGQGQTQGQGKTNPTDKELLYSNIRDFKLDLVEPMDGVDPKSEEGKYFTGMIAKEQKMYPGSYFKKNKANNDIYRITKDNIVASISHRKAKSGKVSESFNMEMIFVNPLLFESVLLEAANVDFEYQCIGDCGGQTILTDEEGTTTTTTTTTGGEQGKQTAKGGTEDSWKSFPCITNNAVIKKVSDPKLGIVYQDKGNIYYSNGRFKDIKTGKMGSYKCDGDKIVSDKKVEAEKPKVQVVTDADLMGETNFLQNVLHSPWLMGSVIPVLAAIEFGTAGAATPLVAAAAGGSGVLASALDRTNRRYGVKGVVDALDGWVDEDDLLYTFMVIKGLDNKFYYDDTLDEPQYISATQAFLDLYQEDEGSDLISDVSGVGTKTLSVGSEKMKKRILATINRQVAQVPPAELLNKGNTNIS